MLRMKAENHERMAAYGFLAILLFQTAMMLFFSVNKMEYHIDEIYSYILSNSYDTDKIKNEKTLKNRWIDGQEAFHDYLSVQPGERFAYNKTYYNNTTDAHPPFYYFVLHTVCSFFPDTFSKWLGLSINIAAFILTQFLLFLISRKIFSGILWQLLPAALYGFSPIAVDIVLYIRMYSLLAFFTVLLFLIHLKMAEGTQKYPYLCCFAVTFLGMFTQYYFAISAFYLAACWCILLWKKKEIRELLCYAAGMLSGVLLVFLLYPAALRQATGSSTNNVGNEVSSNIMNFALIPKHFAMYVIQFYLRMTCSRRFSVVYFLFIVAIVVFAFVMRKKNRFADADNTKIKETGIKQVIINTVKRELKRKNAVYLSVAAIVMLLTVLTIVHISGQFSYLRYLYNIMPVLFLLAVIIIYWLSEKCHLNHSVLSVGLMIFALFVGLNGVVYKNCEYLYTYRHQLITETTEFIGNMPLVVVDKDTNHLMTGNLTLLSNVHSIYITDTDDIDVDELTRDLDTPDGVAFLVLSKTEWSDGYDGDETMQKIIDSSAFFNVYDKFSGEEYSVLYWIHREEQ